MIVWVGGSLRRPWWILIFILVGSAGLWHVYVALLLSIWSMGHLWTSSTPWSGCGKVVLYSLSILHPLTSSMWCIIGAGIRSLCVNTRDLTNLTFIFYRRLSTGRLDFSLECCQFQEDFGVLSSFKSEDKPLQVSYLFQSEDEGTAVTYNQRLTLDCEE